MSSGRVINAISRLSQIHVVRGSGSYVWDSKGRSYLDFTSGIGALSTGHCHPHVVSAIQNQAKILTHGQQNVFGGHDACDRLVSCLDRIIPPGLNRYFFANSGSEAVENALKIARVATGRQRILSFRGAFHGRTFGCLSVTNSKVIYNQGLGPLIAGVHIKNFPDVESDEVAWIRMMKQVLNRDVNSNELAAVILEPIQGEGGIRVLSEWGMRRLRNLCDASGTMLILDEVQTGAGRTGDWWAHTSIGNYTTGPGTGPEADIIIYSKGISSGLPFGGLAIRNSLVEDLTSGKSFLPSGLLGGTAGGNALIAAGVVATIEVIENEGVLDNVRQMSELLLDRLWNLNEMKNCEIKIDSIRGMGLMIGIEFRDNLGRVTGDRLIELIVNRCLENGLLVLTAGPIGETLIRLLPPLIIGKNEVDKASQILKKSMKEVEKSLKK